MKAERDERKLIIGTSRPHLDYCETEVVCSCTKQQPSNLKEIRSEGL